MSRVVVKPYSIPDKPGEDAPKTRDYSSRSLQEPENQKRGS